MTAITYTAKRRLIAGHTIGLSYDLETNSRSIDPGDKIVGDTNVADDGTTEGVLSRIDETWAVTTGAITQAELDSWREFFASVSGAETFTFDAFGTIASPDNAQTVLLEGNPTYSRIGRLSAFTISFKVRVR